MYPGADVEKTQAPIGDWQPKQALGAERADTQIGGVCTRQISHEEIVAEFFKYHARNSQTIPKYAAINQAAKNFAEVVLANCPPGTDRADAIRKIREARMTANAAIALNGLSFY